MKICSFTSNLPCQVCMRLGQWWPNFCTSSANDFKWKYRFTIPSGASRNHVTLYH